MKPDKIRIIFVCPLEELPRGMLRCEAMEVIDTGSYTVKADVRVSADAMAKTSLCFVSTFRAGAATVGDPNFPSLRFIFFCYLLTYSTG